MSILPNIGRIGLEAAVAALLGRAAGRVALDDEQLARAGSRSWQSASLPGSALPSSALLRMTRSRALRAASRARAAVSDFSMIRRAVAGVLLEVLAEALGDARPGPGP